VCTSIADFAPKEGMIAKYVEEMFTAGAKVPYRGFRDAMYGFVSYSICLCHNKITLDNTQVFKKHINPFAKKIIARGIWSFDRPKP
jgi:hypothetical protein